MLLFVQLACRGLPGWNHSPAAAVPDNALHYHVHFTMVANAAVCVAALTYPMLLQFLFEAKLKDSGVEWM